MQNTCSSEFAEEAIWLQTFWHNYTHGCYCYHEINQKTSSLFHHISKYMYKLRHTSTHGTFFLQSSCHILTIQYYNKHICSIETINILSLKAWVLTGNLKFKISYYKRFTKISPYCTGQGRIMNSGACLHFRRCWVGTLGSCERGVG